MIEANSFLPDSVEWLTILAVSVGICLLAMLILTLLRRYSHSIRHLVIATLMVAHLFFLPCFLLLPKLQFEVIPQSWAASVADEVPATPVVADSDREQDIGENEVVDRDGQVPEVLDVEELEFQLATLQSNELSSESHTERPATLGSNNPAPISATAQPESTSIRSTLFWSWLFGFLVIAAWFALAWLWAIRKVAGLSKLNCSRTSELVGSLANRVCVHRPPMLKTWNDDRIPMMLGVFRPVIVLPESFTQWPVSRQRHVLMHELTHIARLDTVHDSIAWLTSACFWFNPLVWVLKKHQAKERELACDQYVVSLSSNAEDYAADLLSVVKEASGFAPSTSIAMARNTELGQRIKSILRFDPSVLQRRKTLPRMLCGFLVVSALLGSTLAFSQVALQETDSEEEVTPFSLEEFSAELNDKQRESLRVMQERLQSQKGDRITSLISATGKVVDSLGEPVVGAEVYLRESVTHRRMETVAMMPELWRLFGDKPRAFVIAKTKTDNEGKFSFVDIETPEHYEAVQYMRQQPRWAVFAKAPGETASFNWHWLDPASSKTNCQIALPETETLFGVVNDSNGNAVSGASVVAEFLSRLAPLTDDERRSQTPKQREQAAFEYFQFGNSAISPKATTDENGRFRIDGLPASYRVRLRVSHPDLILASTDLLQIAGSESNPVSVSLDIGWRLKFLAKDPEGNPVPNAMFALSGGYSKGVSMESIPSFTFTTDEDGHYLSPSLPACDVNVSGNGNSEAELKSGKTSKWLSSRLEVSKGQSDTIVSAEMNLENGKLIHGQIVPLDKSIPITKEEFEELGVNFMPISDDMFDNGASSTAKPDSEGRFAIRVKEGVEGQISVSKSHQADGFDLPGSVENYLFTSRIAQRRKEKERRESRLNKLPRAMVVRRDESDPLESMPSRKTVKAEDDFTPSSPIVLPVARSKTIKGVLVDESGDPVSGALIKILNRQQTNYGAGLQVSFPPDPTTDENGRFEITGVQERFLPFLRAIHPTREDLTAEFAWSSAAEACKGDLKLELKPGPSLKVIVKLNSKPLRGQEVSLSTTMGNSRNGPRGNRKMVTDENGICVFKNLARSKRNFLHVQHSQKDRYTKSISTLGDQMEFTISDVNFISEGSGVVSGQVVDPSGKPVANVKVSAREHHKDRRTKSKFFESVESDAKGSFKLTKIPEDVSVRLEFTPERPKEARYPRSPMPSVRLAKSGDTDLRVIVDPRLSQELPWRSKQKESGQ